MTDKTTPINPDDGEWDLIAEARTKMIFDTDGDTWEGYWEGPEDIVDPNTLEVYEYLNFRNDAGWGFTTPASYQLKRAMAVIKVGTFVRIKRLSITKTAKGNMIDFRVQARK